MTDTSPTMPVDLQWSEIREGVRQVCAEFTNDYWMKLDHASEYPTDFVKALTDAGYLGCLSMVHEHIEDLHNNAVTRFKDD